MAKTTKKTAGKAAAKSPEEAAKTVKKKTAAKKTPTKKKAAAKKAVAKKSTKKKISATKPTAKKAAKKAPVRKSPATAASRRQLSAAERHAMIAEAAYLRGESMGFLTDEGEDWLLAEAEVDARLAKAGIKVSR